MDALVPMMLYDASGRGQCVYVPSGFLGQQNPEVKPQGAAPSASVDLTTFGLHSLPMQHQCQQQQQQQQHQEPPLPPPPSFHPVMVNAPLRAPPHLATWPAVAPPVPTSSAAPPPNTVTVVAPSRSSVLPSAQGNAHLYISNMPPCMTHEKLQLMFSSYGQILKCRLMKKAGNSARPVGFIRFLTPEMAQSALEALDGLVVDGWCLSVKPAHADRERSFTSSPSSNLYVSNLPADCVDSGLRSVFSMYGHILSLVVFKDAQTGLCKGSGMVRFSSTAEATAAIKALHNKTLPGLNRPLEVKYAENKSERAARRATNSPAPPTSSPTKGSATSSSAGSSPELEPQPDPHIVPSPTLLNRPEHHGLPTVPYSVVPTSSIGIYATQPRAPGHLVSKARAPPGFNLLPTSQPFISLDGLSSPAPPPLAVTDVARSHTITTPTQVSLSSSRPQDRIWQPVGFTAKETSEGGDSEPRTDSLGPSSPPSDATDDSSSSWLKRPGLWQ